MKLRTLIISICTLFGSCFAAAQEQDLVQTYVQALENDPVLQQAIANQLATRQGVPIAASQLLPQASIEFYNESQNAFLFPGTVPEDISVQNEITRTYGYIASATQNIINFSTWSLIREARRLAEEADATFVANEQELIYRVANAYFNVLSAEDTLSYATAQKEALASQLDQVQQRFDVGLVAITDVYDFQAQYDAQVSQEIEAINNVANAKEALQVITGLYIDELAPLKPTIPLLQPEPMDMNAWVEQAEYDNPTLAASRFAMRAAEESVSTQRAQFYPDLQLAGEYGQTHNGQVFDSQPGSGDGWVVVVQSTMNVFSGGQIISQVRQAEYQYESARDAYEAQRRNTVNQTRSAFRAIETAMSQVTALEQAVISAQSALDA
ncbi:MAG: TolC family outer membrane protein, partial [Gammaproteobacteria bacterium]